MNTDALYKSLSAALPPLFECSPAPRDGIRVRTPLLFPDGGVIDVYVLERDGAFTVTDFGDAAGWLGLQTVSQNRTARQRELIADTCRTLGIELKGEMLVLRKVLSPGLADAVMRLAQAEARVADVWFTMRQSSGGSMPEDVRRSPGQSTADDVDEWLRRKRFSVERGHKVIGRSGRVWPIDFRATAPTAELGGGESWIFLLSAGTRRATRGIVEHVVTGLVDLRDEKTNLPRISVFDDVAGVWGDNDYRLVEEHSAVARWSRRDELEELLIPGMPAR